MYPKALGTSSTLLFHSWHTERHRHEPGPTTMGTLFVIFLFIWMYSPSTSRRNMCLSWMGSHKSPDSESARSAADFWGRVQEEATASGIITSGTFPDSLRRDLKDERVLNGNLNDIGCLLLFYIASPQPPDSFLAHELLAHALAAARRGLCMAFAGSSFQLGPLLTSVCLIFAPLRHAHSIQICGYKGGDRRTLPPRTHHSPDHIADWVRNYARQACSGIWSVFAFPVFGPH